MRTTKNILGEMVEEIIKPSMVNSGTKNTNLI